MPLPTAPKPENDRGQSVALDEEPDTTEGPPEEEFWDRYNKRLEFPLASVGTVFLHILVFGAIVAVFLVAMNLDEDRTNPPLQLVQVGGLDDAGEGSAGSGGQEDPALERDADPIKAAERSFATPEALKDAKENIKQIALDDPTGSLPIAAPNVKAYSDLDESVRKKLLGVGGRKGEGNQPGKGFDGSAGAGPGGTGADSTRARGLRWVLRFRITSGTDYVDQLRAMGAEILVPLPPDNKKCIIVRDLGSPSPKVATEADLNRLAGKIQFSDSRAQPVREVLAALGVEAPSPPKAFWAFFPKDVEEQLANKEKGYRNRRPEDIEETVFRVTVRGGTFDLVVDEQIPKK